jgi:glyoxylate carboligase
VSDSPAPTETADKPVNSEAPTTREAVLVVVGVDVAGTSVLATGYVSGVIEDGGRCVFEFTHAADVVTIEQAGVADRMSTSCSSGQVPLERFDRGTWMAVLAYEGLSGETTTSEPIDLEIP